MRHLLTSTIYVASPTGVDAWGAPAYSAAVAMACRLSAPTNTRARGAKEADTAGVQHVVYTLTPVSADARVWLSSADTSNPSKALRPKAVRTHTSPSGLVLVEVQL